jgi:hypothetical protein
VLLLSLESRSFGEVKNPEPKSSVDFLHQSGFSSVRLKRTIYHLVMKVKINGHPATMVIATNNPISQIDRKQLRKFQLTEKPSGLPIAGAFGGSQQYGLATVNTLTISRTIFHEIPVATVSSNIRPGVPPYDGVFALADCQRIGAMIDCNHRVLYFDSNGPDRKASEDLRVRLAREGFTRVPLHVKSQGYLEAACRINGHCSHMLVSVESFATVLTPQTAVDAGEVYSTGTRGSATALGGRMSTLNGARIKELSIGKFEIRNANVNVTRSQTNNLGIDQLEVGHAIIDIGGLALYLKH